MKKIKNFGSFIMFLTTFGCSSDYRVKTIIEEMQHAGVRTPEIEVYPLEHDFGILSAGSETVSTPITIENIGDEDLNINEIYLNNNTGNFALSLPDSYTIKPSEKIEVIATYSPITYESSEDILNITSDDDDEPNVEVSLKGMGDSPVISINPSYYDFGKVYLGCNEDLVIEVGNIGSSNLIISDIEYFASLPADFEMTDFRQSWGELPISIAPGDTIELNVGYTPMDSQDDAGYIEILSNDPVDTVAYADQDGLGEYEAWNTDFYTQDGNIDVDILFVIDNSGSMGSNQVNLKNNFDSFMTAFSNAGVSYNIALITTDSPFFVGDVITPHTPNPIQEFSNQMDSIGTSGNAIEQGLLMAHDATIGTGDAGPFGATGFFRHPSRLVVVYVSDEPDMSSNGSSLTTSDYSYSLSSLKSSPNLIIAHAIAGDYPGGCSSNGSAQFGDGYYDVVNDLGGTFMSICASDWSMTMDSLARDSIAMSEFSLSGNPIEETIEIKINGSISNNWTYDYYENSISMATTPPEGSSIEIKYAVWSYCKK